MPGGMVSNISWRFLKFFKPKTSPEWHPDLGITLKHHPTERNLLLQIDNDQLLGIPFDASEMMSFALFAASGPSHVLGKWPGSEWGLVATWLPFSIYHFLGVCLVVFLTSNFKGWGGVKKGHFIGLHVLNRCLVQSFKQKRVFQRMKHLQSKKKVPDVFSGQRSSWKSSNLLWTVHPPPPGNSHSLELGSLVTLIAVNHPNLCKKTQNKFH